MWILQRPEVPQAPRIFAKPRSRGSLDGVRAAFWQAYRHLFPPQAMAAQTPQGSLVISWPVMDEPHALFPYAAPVVLRFDDALLAAMRPCDMQQRLRIAHHHEATLREGLRGYDPFAAVPKTRVVTLG
jgi:hypothetical protein